MKYAWLAVPILLLLALGIAFYFSQPKQNPTSLDDSDYVNVNGDQYLKSEYVTDPAQALTDTAQGIPSNFVYPAKLSDCENFSDIASQDRCYDLYAQRSNDVAGCEATKGVDSRDDCFLALAVQLKKPDLCEKVNFGREECYLNTAIESGNASLCERSAANILQCERAVASGSISDCPIGDDMHYCGDAVVGKNKALCGQLRSYDQYCYLQVGIDSNNSSLCNKAGDAADHCFFKIATTVNNPKICEGINERQVRDNCVAWVAYNTGNRQLCYQAGTEAQSCIDDIDSGQ